MALTWQPTYTEAYLAYNGFYGTVFESGTTPVTGDFCKFHVVAAAKFAALTGNISGDSIVGVTCSAGQDIYGRFTAFTLTSGSVQAFKTGSGI